MRSTLSAIALAAMIAGLCGPVAFADNANDETIENNPETDGTVATIIRRLDPDQQTVEISAKGPTSVTITLNGEPHHVVVDYGHALDMTVYFEYNSAVLTEIGAAELDKLGVALNSNDLRSHRYLIAGHTDSRGSHAYNADLSVRRAVAVRDYLVREWEIDPSRLEVHGWGETLLKDPRNPKSGVNRRVEIAAIVSGPVLAPALRGRITVDGRQVADFRNGSVVIEVDADRLANTRHGSAGWIVNRHSVSADAATAIIKGRPARVLRSDPRPAFMDLDDFGGYRTNPPLVLQDRTVNYGAVRITID